MNIFRYINVYFIIIFTLIYSSVFHLLFFILQLSPAQLFLKGRPHNKFLWIITAFNYPAIFTEYATFQHTPQVSVSTCTLWKSRERSLWDRS